MKILRSREFFSKVACSAFSACLFSSLPASVVAQTAKGSVSTTVSKAGDSSADLQAALKLYNAKQYGPAADAFEKLMASGKADAMVCYYAALANRASGHETRAKQLFQYVVANFPTTTQAKYSTTALGGSVGSATSATATSNSNGGSGSSSAADPAPASGSGSGITAYVGGSTASTLASTTRTSTSTPTSKSSASVSSSSSNSKFAPGAYCFTEREIAALGSKGVDQSSHPNCWFEASLSCLADLPRGQRLLATMIRRGSKDCYIVRFPNDGVEYVVPDEALAHSSVRDKADWATIIECAQLQKFGENGGYVEVGLACLTGAKAETVMAKDASIQELSSFIGGAIKSRNPIVCATNHDLSGLPAFVFPSHAHTIIDFDPSQNIVTIRNPHGSHSRMFKPQWDGPNKPKAEQLPDGIYKMDLATFQQYFRLASRAFI